MTGWRGVEHLLTPNDAAAALAVSTWTLARMRRDGELPAVRVGGGYRYEPSAIRDYITTHRSNA